jgi:dipeptidyl aminopeptidase/acylaminoacyl peptidase
MARTADRLHTIAALFSFALTLFGANAAMGQSFTLKQALSAPFASDLVASPKLGRFAWVENEQGKRNVWIAIPGENGKFEAKRLTAYNEDDGQEVFDIAWTPDAQHIVYVRGGDDEFPGTPNPNPALNPDGVSQNVWLIAATGGEPRNLGSGYGPVISPQGDQVAFISHDKIWSAGLAPDAPKAKLLLHTRGDISDLLWSPDGHALAFVSERHDHSFIGVYDVHGDKLLYLDPSTEYDSHPVWSPDGREIAFIRVPGAAQPAPTDHRMASPWSIRIADAGTGQGHQVWKANEGQGSAFHEIYGKQLSWTGDNRLVFPWEADGWSHLYSVPTSGGKALLLTPGNFEVRDINLAEDHKSVLYSSNQQDIDRRHIWMVAASGGAPKELTHGTGIEVSPVEAGKRIVMLRSDAHTPLRPALLDASGKPQDLAPQIIPADYPGAKFARPQPVLFRAADGLQIHGQIYLPANANDGKRHPALVFFHGGSRRQMLLGFHTMQYYSNAYAMDQYLVNLGYIVLAVNYRSGIGYGLDFREALNYGRHGASEYNDILGAGNYLRSRSDVDQARIGVWGGSWGGFMTAMALARASNIFAAGVDMHGVHEWKPYSSWRPSHDPAADAESRKILWESSPMAYVSSWKSPVLLIQGDDDRNVDFSQTVSLARALRKQGTPFEELVFPDEIHGFLLHRSWLAAYSAEANFFQRHLMHASATPKEHQP